MRFWLDSSLFNISSAKLHLNYAKYIETQRTEDDYKEDIDECD